MTPKDTVKHRLVMRALKLAVALYHSRESRLRSAWFAKVEVEVSSCSREEAIHCVVNYQLNGRKTTKSLVVLVN